MLRDDGVDELPRIEGLDVEGELPCLDLRQVEDLVDQPEEILPAALHPAERRLLLGVERTVHAREERIGEAEDRGHRRAQLMADVRQETRLRLAAPFERRVGVGQPRRQRPLIVEQCGQALARAVDVSRQASELVAVRHVDTVVEVAGGDVCERSSILRTGRMNAHERTNPSVRATITLRAENAITMPVKRSCAD